MPKNRKHDCGREMEVLADKYPSSSGGAEAVERQDVRLDGRVLS